jgi:hypothetical protein
MTDAYYAAGTTLANMLNIETDIETPPTAMPDALAPLLGSVRTQLMDSSVRRDGFINHRWLIDPIKTAEFRALLYAVLGDFVTSSATVYITTIDEAGYYSPFLCELERPYIGDHYETAVGGWRRSLIIPLLNLRLQSVTKSATYTMTSSDRLIYGYTNGGGFTLTLPSAAGVTANTIYSIEKADAANTLTIARAGSDTVDGGASVTLAVNHGRYDLASDGVSAWASVLAAQV